VIFIVWQDPSEPVKSTTSGTSAPVQQQQAPMPSSLPPISSYGSPGQTWNKETMELLVNIEIPKHILEQGRNSQLFVWYKQALMQLQFGNYTGADQRKMIKALRYIIFLSQQEGNDQIVFEEQLLFISTLMISKGRSDKPEHGIRERTAWIMQVIKNSITTDEAQRPAENKGTWNIPFIGGK
jgi:hypothetical protein